MKVFMDLVRKVWNMLGNQICLHELLRLLEHCWDDYRLPAPIYYLLPEIKINKMHALR